MGDLLQTLSFQKKNPGKMPADYSGSTTWGSFLYSFILTHGQRQLQTPVTQISAAGPQVSISQAFPEILEAPASRLGICPIPAGKSSWK